VVLRPTGTGMFTWAGGAVLLAAACYSVSAITVRIVIRTDSVDSQLFWLMTMVALGAGALAWPQWTPVRMSDGWVLGGIAITGFLGQLSITEAFRNGEASAIAPFEYSALAWGWRSTGWYGTRCRIAGCWLVPRSSSAAAFTWCDMNRFMRKLNTPERFRGVSSACQRARPSRVLQCTTRRSAT
jgi:hypothetical protein